MTAQPTPVGPGPIPARAGIGLRVPHYGAMLESLPRVGWLEVHAENYFVAGGKHIRFLERIRAHYPLSIHGVGLSLGSTDPLSTTHLTRIRSLIERFQPALVSEHISWGSVGGYYLNDLLPLPYTEEALRHMVERVAAVQDFLGRGILVENVSSYLQYRQSDIPEWEFVAELARRAGCGILLDVNNIYVNARNHGNNAALYIDHIPQDLVGEIHLAGFTVNALKGGELLIDTHSRPVCDDVWDLYDRAIGRFGARPTLIEWDQDLPPLEGLVAEAARADAILERHHVRAA